MSFRQQFWSLRQNPWATTDQTQMRDFIVSQKTVSCPFGHFDVERNNVVAGAFNESSDWWKSRSQDRRFIDEMKIGDIVVIPFPKQRTSILARIVSAPIYGVDTGLFTRVQENGIVSLLTEGDTPFRPVGRQIEIIDANYVIPDKRVLPRVSLCKINPAILPEPN
jgi:hypothetical protein